MFRVDNEIEIIVGPSPRARAIRGCVATIVDNVNVRILRSA